MASRNPAADQLPIYRDKVKSTGKFTATTAGGAVLINKDASVTVGSRGPIALSDVQFVEEVAHFVRERIPERVLHARGAGAFGIFEATADITPYTKAKLFRMGKRTPVIVRFSTTIGESGSPETMRDPKGMGVKFQTEDGILDLTGNHIPVYFVRDPILFPSLVHANKRNPKTHLHDANMFWDFISLRPETMSSVLHLFSKTGIPDGWRKMNFYPTVVYRLVNFNGKVHYCKFAFYCKEIKAYLSSKEAAKAEPDHYTRDLYNAIEKRNYPVWMLYIQVMTELQAKQMLSRPVNPFDPFDNTKTWSTKEFPLINIGRLTLTENPSNYFAEIEQLAFAPANMVPGIEPSPYDKIFQGRIFVYPDAQRYRLGANYQQLGVNRPMNVKTYQRDGPQTYHYQGEEPSYHPNTFWGSEDVKIPIQRFEFRTDIFFTFIPPFNDDLWQNQLYFQDLDGSEKKVLAENIAGSLRLVTDPDVQKRMLDRFNMVDAKLHKMILSKI